MDLMLDKSLNTGVASENTPVPQLPYDKGSAILNMFTYRNCSFRIL